MFLSDKLTCGTVDDANQMWSSINIDIRSHDIFQCATVNIGI
jgi:hypothetical protein